MSRRPRETARPSNSRPAATLATQGARLRHARQVRGLTQAQLAARAGLEQTTISKLETNDRRRADVATLVRIAKALDVSPAWLRDGPGALPDPDVLPAPLAGEQIEAALVALDALLDAAFDPRRHRATDVAYLRPLLLDHLRALATADGHGGMQAAVATWLDAVHALRAAGRPIDFATVVLHAAGTAPPAPDRGR